MGCDIHWYSETKKDNAWVCDQANSYEVLLDEDNAIEMDNFPGRDRDYWFFGLIQPGVRNDFKWSFPERIGVPKNLSIEVAAMLKSWEGDAHSEGYLTREEIKTKLKELKEYQARHLIAPIARADALQGHVTKLNAALDNLTSEVADDHQRIIFWFDN